MSILKVTEHKEQLLVSYPSDYSKEKVEKIKKWLQHLSPGYVEHLLKFNEEPHCSSCRDMSCEDVGSGNDACPGFKYTEKW